jgi:hypothetical protein
VLDAAARRALFAHELAHLAHPTLSERQVARRSPVPDLSPLLPVLPGGRRTRAGFVDVGRPGGAARQGPELGPHPHPLLARLVRVDVHRPDGRRLGWASGVLYATVAGTGYVLTNRHVVAQMAGRTATVALAGPAGEVVLPAVAVPAPDRDRFAAELVAAGAAADHEQARWRIDVEGVDVALLRITGPRSAAAVAPARIGRARSREAVAVLGFPATVVPTAAPAGIAEVSAGVRLAVVSGGLVVDHPGLRGRLHGLKIAGNPWYTHGNSGGPVGAAGRRADPDLLLGLVSGFLPVERLDAWPGVGRVVRAVDGPVLAAFVRASAPLGGAALLSGRAIDQRAAAVVAHVVAGLDPLASGVVHLPATSPLLPALTGGLGAAEFAAARCAGVCAVAGLAERIAAVGGPGDLVAWAAADGWVYLDLAVFDALRRGALDAGARRRLFEHELTHRADPRRSEAQVLRDAPLPDLRPLAAAVGPRPIPAPVVFTRVREGRHGPDWQAPELGPRAHPGLPRIVQLLVRRGTVGSRTTGVLLDSADGAARVLTVRHLVEGLWPGEDGELTVLVPDGRGELRLPGWVLAPPALPEFGARLAAAGAAADPAAGRALARAEAFDLALVRVRDPRLAAVRLAAPGFGSAGAGQPVAVLGLSRTSIPVPGATGVVDRAIGGDGVVVQTGRVVEHLGLGFGREVKLAGDPWIGPGCCGGPVVPAPAAADPDVLLGLVTGAYRPGSFPGWREEGWVGTAVPGPVLAAFIGASRADGAFALAREEAARLTGALARELAARPGGAPAGELAVRLGARAEEVLFVAGRSARFGVGQDGWIAPGG